MDRIAFTALLRELEVAGKETDARTQHRHDKLRNVTPDAAALLAQLIQATSARDVLEVGTSNGYSTLWLADAVRRTGGKVLTIELDGGRARLARANFARAGLAELIELREGDAGVVLAALPDRRFDFVFLDAERGSYVAWWPSLRRTVRPGGLIVVDNAISHATELTDFVDAVGRAEGFSTSLLPIGKGELLILRELPERT